MRQKVILFLIISNLGICKDNPVYEDLNQFDDSSLSEELKSQYIEDASRLTVGEMRKKRFHYDTHIAIDDSIFNRYYSSLVSIYNSFLPVRDTIVDSLELHTNHGPNLYFVSVTTNKEATWTKFWKNGKSFTGIEIIDSTMKKHSLSISQFIPKHRQMRNSNNDYFTMKSDTPINTNALSIFLNSTKYIVRSSSGSAYIGDISNIYGDMNENNVILTYRLGMGDCPAGCTCVHRWIIQVDRNGNVKCIDQNGDYIYFESGKAKCKENKLDIPYPDWKRSIRNYR